MSEVVVRVNKISELREASDVNDLNTLSLLEATGLTEILELELADGTSYALDKTDPKFTVWKEFLDWQRESDLSVYVAVESPSGIVRELLPVFKRIVETVDPTPVGGRLRVVFHASPAIYYLNPALAHFVEFRDSLSSAARDHSSVLVTHHPATFEILDVRAVPADSPGLSNGVSVIEITPPFVPVSNLTLSMSEITTQKAFEVFELLAASGIPFSYVWDCCTARAQKMCNILLQDHNILARKIWNYGHGFKLNVATLSVKTPLDPSGKVFWRYHVAPTVRVVDGTVNDVVLDPSLFKAPVALNTWLLVQNDDKATQEFSDKSVYENQPNSPNDLFEPDPQEVDKKLKTEAAELILHSIFNGLLKNS
jgi:Glutaminase